MNSADSLSSAVGATACPMCGHGGLESKAEVERFPYGTGDATIELSVKVTVYKCHNCDFSFTDENAANARHDAVCRYRGIQTPSEIRQVRKLNNVSRAEFSRVSRIGSASLARWEKGLKFQNPACDSLLYLLVFQENFERLRRRSGGFVVQSGTEVCDDTPQHSSEQKFGLSGRPQLRICSPDDCYTHLVRTHWPV